MHELQAEAREQLTSLPYICWIQLTTNISTHRISVYVIVSSFFSSLSFLFFLFSLLSSLSLFSPLSYPLSSSHALSFAYSKVYVIDGGLTIDRIDRIHMERYDFKKDKRERGEGMITSKIKKLMVPPIPADIPNGQMLDESVEKTVEKVSIHVGHISVESPKSLEILLTNTK